MMMTMIMMIVMIHHLTTALVGILGPCWLQVGGSWDHFGSKLGCLGAILAPFWGILGPSWLQFGWSWGVLGGSRRVLGPCWLQEPT